MQQTELYDFDDMILRVVHAMEVFPELRFNLQEKHQYIMVDEFQDTNMAQMRIILDLTTTPSGDQPNIMVVGDDDQAIYSFQGAEVGNIIHFRELYESAPLITLTDNYRSAPVILDHARKVITLGEDRLENHIEEVNKTLVPNHAPTESDVRLMQHETVSDEYAWLVTDITARVKAGESASDIAVLARRHHEIVALLPYFADAGIKVNYERRDNVLDLDVITHIELLGNVLSELFVGHHDHAEGYLPELLAHPAWGIEPQDLWRLSLNARQNHKTWLEVMKEMPAFMLLHQWLLETAQLVEYLPLERMVDRMIGHEAEPTSDFTSPLYRYFFSREKLAEQPDEYLTYLEALRTIRHKLSEYRPNETPKLQTFLEFIRLHRRLGSTIESVRPHATQLSDAVNLMTAHKSKGLEFKNVYIIGAIDSAWGERVRSRSSLISYPENLPLAPAGNTPDERLRLFFVAMTRARNHLTISYSQADTGSKQTLPAHFLVGDDWQPKTASVTHTIDTLVHAAELRWYQPLVTMSPGTMKEILGPMLERYKLSVTDLCTFLDVSHGGPQAFLLTRLLRFPQAASPSAAYGNAVHRTLQRAHTHLTATHRHRAVEDILQDYVHFLDEQHLAEEDYQTYLQKGSDALQAFLAAKYIDFKETQQAELNFASQHSTLGDAQLTGSIDLIDHDDKTMIVTDYKTGHPVRSWKGISDYDKIKLHRYRQQLLFYKLLVEHSRDYSHFTVSQGILQFVEPTKAGEIIALETTFTNEEIADFTRLIQKVWLHIKNFDFPDTSAYEPTYKGVLAFESDLLKD